MLQIADLAVDYHNGKQTVRALGPLNLRLPRGGIAAVIGPSGSGKSTLLHALAGVLPVKSGSMALGGEPVSPKRHRIGFIPQDYGLLPWKTVRANCELALSLKGMAHDADARARMEDIAARLDIAALMSRFPRELSGGQRQRAAIARAFSLNPELLLMDEPFSALDALTREEAQALFLAVWQEYRPTALFVTHSVEEAVTVGQHILLLSHAPGQVLEVVENPCFGMAAGERGDAFAQTAAHIRALAQRGWQA